MLATYRIIKISIIYKKNSLTMVKNKIEKLDGKNQVIFYNVTKFQF